MGRRDERDEERWQAELDGERRDGMTPARRVHTPREEAEAYAMAAASCFRRRGADVPAGLAWLERALGVLRDPRVVDGAELLEDKIEGALEALWEGEMVGVEQRLLSALELVRRRTRVTDSSTIPAGRDLEDDGPQARKRLAVLAVLVRHRMELSIGDAPAKLLDEIVAAAETGI